jgi:polyisoprenoid-binding protein YceI
MKKFFKLSPMLLGGIGVALVVLAAGGFFAIKAIEGNSPPPLTAPVAALSPTPLAPAATSSSSSPSPTVTPAASTHSASPTVPAPAAAAATASPAPPPSPTPTPSPTPPPSYDGAWHVGAGSVAGYRVKETLFGASNIAVGRTSSITGSLTVAGGKLTAGNFSVDVATVRSDRSARDDSFKIRIMEVGTYPTASFNLTQPVDIGRLASGSGHQVVNVTGNLQLHGVTRLVTFPVNVTRTGASVNVTGAIPVTFADYAIANPSNPIAQTENSGTLEFSLNFVRG